MLRILGLSTVAMLVLAGPMAARAADSVTGEVIDLGCYLAHSATGHGANHRKCAEACAKKGIPMGLLQSDKTIVLLLESHESPKPYAAAIARAADTITVEGRRVSEGGMNGIVVEAVK